MKKLTTIFAVVILCAYGVKAQWVNQGAWPDTSVKGQMHGVAVDPDGKVWAANFGAEKFVPEGSSDTLTVRLIRVYNPDGTPASFSPIWKATIGSETDTLFGSSSRGMCADQNGNILYVDAPPSTAMYRFNYQTGEAMNKVVLGTGSPTAPAVADDGTIFVGPVTNSGSKIEMYDADFSYLGDAVPDSILVNGYSRDLEVSADGNTIYFPSYTLGAVFVYQRTSEFEPYDSVGTIMNGVHCESIEFNPATGDLWVAGGSFTDKPDSGSGFSANTWYAYDLGTSSVVDSLKWTFTVPDNPAERPRGIAFSPDGNIAYIGCFGGSGYPLIQKVVNTSTGIEQEPNVMVKDYSLSQNYPNPFNPTTNIKFSVPKSGLVTLKVYDMLGREVAQLVNKVMATGAYTVDFDASNLASGTYVYQLTAGNVQLSKKMILLK